MAESEKVLVNLATGLGDAERVMVAFLVATAAIDRGKRVAIWLTKEPSGSPYPVLPTVLRATAAHRSRDSESNSRPVRVSC